MIRRTVAVLCLAAGLSVGLFEGPVAPSAAEPSAVPALSESGSGGDVQQVEPAVREGVARPSPGAPDRRSRVRAPAADTLQRDVQAGETIIVALPASLDAGPVDRYRLLQGPALSGVADRSFAWVTNAVDPGTYDVRLAAETDAAAPDTLVLRVTVR
jgi:hypothetical protein